MIIQLHFFYTDQQSAAIQAVTWGSPGNSVASVAAGKKQNTTVQFPHFIVNRHPLLFFFKPFRTLSSIHYNTRSIFILREASTRGVLEVPWWRTPNRVIRACGVLWKTQVPHQQVPSFTYLGNPHNSQFLPSQQWVHIGMCQPGYCVTSQNHNFSSPRTDKEKQ